MIDLRLTMLLADYVQVAEGKLFISGAGWTFLIPGVGPMAIAILAEVPWDRANHNYSFEVRLYDEDDRPALAPDGNPVHISGGFETGRPPGHPKGAPLAVPLAINVPPFPLDAGKRWEWRVSVDGETRDDWRLAFNTVAEPPSTPPPGPPPADGE